MNSVRGGFLAGTPGLRDARRKYSFPSARCVVQYTKMEEGKWGERASVERKRHSCKKDCNIAKPVDPFSRNTPFSQFDGGIFSNIRLP